MGRYRSRLINERTNFMIRKSIFAGMSNYRGASLKEICEEVARFQSITIKDIEEFEKLREEINKSENEKFVEELNDCLNRRIAVLGANRHDFGRLINEIPKGVKEIHCQILESLVREMWTLKDLNKAFRESFPLYVNNSKERWFADAVYSRVGDLLADYEDLKWLLEILRTYVGAKIKREKKEKSLNKARRNNSKKQELWDVPKDTYFFKLYDTSDNTVSQFIVMWQGKEHKLNIREGSKQDNIFAAFHKAKEDGYNFVKADELSTFIDPKQPLNKDVRDINKSLLAKLRRKLGVNKCGLPKELFVFNTVEKAYQSLIPFVSPDEIDLPAAVPEWKDSHSNRLR